MYKYQTLLGELGYADASAVSVGFAEKVKKFNDGVAEYNKLKASLDGNISADRKKAIEEELADIDVNAGDEQLVKALEKYHKNKDVYAENAKKLAAARNNKGQKASAPAKNTNPPAPNPPAPNPPAPNPPAPNPPAPNPPAPNPPAPNPPAPNPPAPNPPAPNPPAAPQSAQAGGEVEKKDNISGWALAGILVLSALGLGMWAKRRRG